MAIALDVSTPAVRTATSGNLTSASFSPPAGSLLVAVCAGGWGNSASNVTVTDSSGGGNWTGDVANSQSNGFGGCTGIFYKYFASAPGSISVSANFTSINNATVLAVRVLTGTDSVDPIGATPSGSHNGNATQAITPQVTDSWLYGASNDNNNNNDLNPNGNTAVLGQMTNNFSNACTFEYNSNPAETTNSVTLGGSYGAGVGNVLLYEIKPLPGQTYTRDFSDDLTLDDSGVPPQFTAAGTVSSRVDLSDAVTSETGAIFDRSFSDTEGLDDAMDYETNSVPYSLTHTIRINIQ